MQTCYIVLSIMGGSSEPGKIWVKYFSNASFGQTAEYMHTTAVLLSTTGYHIHLQCRSIVTKYHRE